MYQFLKKCLLILIIFTAGIAVGSYYSPLIQDLMGPIWEKIHQESKNNEPYFCPPAEVIIKHQYNPEEFQAGELYWQMDYQGWKAPGSVGFMQALINHNNNLVCYYRWPNPKDMGTYLWMTIHLSPSVNQVVKPYGPYWTIEKKEKQALCTSGINACAFILSESSK